MAAILILFPILAGLLLTCKFPFRRYWMWYVFGVLLYVPTALYIFQFHDHSLSDDPAMWGVFGDFFGGVYGVVITLMVAYISYRVSKIEARGEAEVKVAKELLKQLKVIQTNGYHHNSIQKLQRMLIENETDIDRLLRSNLIDLADSYTRARAEKTEVNKNLESAVMEKLKSLCK